jgi:hypothetical protein
MNSHRTPVTRALVVALCALAAAGLAACNGEDSPGMAATPAAPPAPAAVTSVPAAALASVPAFIGFVAGLHPDDTHEPLSVMEAEAPVSDSAEPQGS